MTAPRSLCVYCGSSIGSNARIQDAARRLGRLMAENGIRLVFGGGRVGLMGLVADAVLDGGGEVVGIIPEFLDTREVGHRGVTELHVVDSMHSRKNLMVELSDAFAVLPGGFGTLDETFEILTWRQLRLHDKPVVLVDLDGYWDPFLRLVEHVVQQGFAHPDCRRLFTVVNRVEDVLDALLQAPRPVIDVEPRRL